MNESHKQLTYVSFAREHIEDVHIEISSELPARPPSLLQLSNTCFLPGTVLTLELSGPCSHEVYNLADEIDRQVQGESPCG